ncbi:MAG: DUF3619 family protein [Methylophilaceae bacterium]
MKSDEHKTILIAPDIEGEEALAKTAASLLNENAQHLNAVTLKKLATARNQAVNRLLAQQSGGINQNGHVLQWFGHDSYFGQHKLMAASILVGAVLLIFLATQKFNKAQNSVVSYQESSDAFLLASDLPPEAFADKGFSTWVVTRRN